MSLQITVIQAKDLPAADTNGKSDPFAELHLNGVTYKTKTIKKTLTPYWGETFTFHPGNFNPNTDSVRLDVYDWDRFSKNDLLTRNLLPISKYVAAGTVEEWITLNSIKGNSRASMQLKVVYGDGKPKMEQPQSQPQSQSQPPQHGWSAPQQQPQGYGSGGFPPQSQGYPSQQQFGHPTHQGGWGGPQQGYGSGGFPQVPQGYGSGGFPQVPQGYGSQQGGWGGPQPTTSWGGPQQGYGSGGFPQGFPSSQQGLCPPPPQGFPSQQAPFPQQQGLQPPRWTGPTHGLPPAEIREAEEAFRRYDTDHSGTIDRNELKPLLRAVFGNRMNENLMDRYAAGHLQAADTDRSGEIDFGEFLDLYARLKQLAGRPL